MKGNAQQKFLCRKLAEKSRVKIFCNQGKENGQTENSSTKGKNSAGMLEEGKQVSWGKTLWVQQRRDGPQAGASHVD